MLSIPIHESPRTSNVSFLSNCTPFQPNVSVKVISNESFSDIPLAHDLSTPRISECSDEFDLSNTLEAPQNGNPTTPNWAH